MEHCARACSVAPPHLRIAPPRDDFASCFKPAPTLSSLACLGCCPPLGCAGGEREVDADEESYFDREDSGGCLCVPR